ncbi:hypothetical protein DFH09DRAFT_1104459 [Mycena vulgaris]|nr:hypothetical protein DFH09DRAFT_1104459 [Mycena vulgaris]
MAKSRKRKQPATQPQPVKNPAAPKKSKKASCSECPGAPDLSSCLQPLDPSPTHISLSPSSTSTLNMQCGFNHYSRAVYPGMPHPFPPPKFHMGYPYQPTPGYQPHPTAGCPGWPHYPSAMLSRPPGRADTAHNGHGLLLPRALSFLSLHTTKTPEFFNMQPGISPTPTAASNPSTYVPVIDPTLTQSSTTAVVTMATTATVTVTITIPPTPEHAGVDILAGDTLESMAGDLEDGRQEEEEELEGDKASDSANDTDKESERTPANTP